MNREDRRAKEKIEKLRAQRRHAMSFWPSWRLRINWAKMACFLVLVSWAPMVFFAIDMNARVNDLTDDVNRMAVIVLEQQYTIEELLRAHAE